MRKSAIVDLLKSPFLMFKGEVEAS
jgi:hypothetical protein